MEVWRILRWVGIAQVVGAVTWVVPGTARALTCATNSIQAPADAAVDVPTNTLLWSYGFFGGASPPRLIGPSGEVPLQQRFWPVAIGTGHGANFPVGIPADELEPFSLYSIEVDYDLGGGSIDTERVSFTTGGGPEGEPPAPPELISSERTSNGWALLDFEYQGILIGDSAGALGSVRSVADLMLGVEAGFDGIEVSASSPVVRWLTTASTLPVGRGECSVWPEDDERRQELRFGTFDLAGNFSGWGSTQVFTLPAGTGTEIHPPAPAAPADIPLFNAPAVSAPSANGVTSNAAAASLPSGNAEASGCALSGASRSSNAGYPVALFALGLALARRRR